MKIVELRAENVKRLKAVQITPDGTVQVIAGRNAQGKSSVLDAIWLALGGGKASKEIRLPIRDGQDRASVRLDLGELVVTRIWTKGGTSLKVESPDGAVFRSPQAILDGLVGKIAFDPLEFTRLSPAKQREQLLSLLGIDEKIKDFAAQRETLYRQRTEVGREAAAIGQRETEWDEELPVQEIRLSAVLDELREAQEGNARVEELLENETRWTREIQEIEAKIHRLTCNLRVARENAERASRELDSAGNIVDIWEIEGRLRSLEQTNAKIRANNAARQQFEKKMALQSEWHRLSGEIEKIDEEKADVLKLADFPVAGLGFSESGVTFGGIPFSQASSAEQIRVSLAMAMAANPRLRVLRITDGSLLDDETMGAIRDQVADRGFQVWIERVGDGDRGAVIIEDGQTQS